MDAQWRIQGGCIPISRSLQKIIILHSGIHHKNPIQEVYYLYLAMRLNSLTALNISKNILRDLYAVILGCWRCLICPQLSIRSIRLRDAPTSSWGVIRYQGHCSQLVCIPEWSPAVRSKLIYKVVRLLPCCLESHRNRSFGQILFRL